MPVSIIGAMSGSSLDGLDLALCQFDEADGHVTWSLEHGETISFPDNIKEALRLAHTISGSKLMELDAVFGIHLFPSHPAGVVGYRGGSIF